MSAFCSCYVSALERYQKKPEALTQYKPLQCLVQAEYNLPFSFSLSTPSFLHADIVARHHQHCSLKIFVSKDLFLFL